MYAAKENRYLKCLLFLLILFASLSSTIVRVEAKSTDFVIKNSVLTSYNGNSSTVTIPDTVKTIGKRAFIYSNLKKVIIPSSVTKIEENAFQYCEALADIQIKNKKVTIEDNVFEGTAWLKNRKDEYVVLNGNLIDYNGNDPFVVIPNSVRVICGGAFDHLAYLEIVEIPNSVNIIGKNAFSNKKDLRKVTMTDSVTVIEAYAFDGCKWLEKVEFSKNITELGDHAFYDTLIEKSMLPKNIKNMGKEVTGQGFFFFMEADSRFTGIFYDYGKSYDKYNGNSTKVVIPKGYDIIGGNAFYNNKKVKEIVIPEGVTLIESNAFEGCTNLEKITLPNSLKDISAGAFKGCTKLKTVTIPKNVTNMCDEIFLDCKSLESVKILGKVTELGSSTFEGCSNLKKVYLAEGIKIIGRDTFSECSKLTDISLPDGMTDIGDSAFYGCKNLSKITLPKTIRWIGKDAFSGCSSLSSITLPNGVVNIMRNTFHGCKNLTSVKLPTTLKSIGDSAFSYCNSLNEINLPKNLMTIGPEAFSSCSNLSNISIPANVVSIGDHAFEECDIKEIQIPEGIKEIESGTFQYCENLKKVVLPNSIKSIGDSAFENCMLLSKVNLPENLDYIGERAFIRCENFYLDKLPDCKIGNKAFLKSGYYRLTWPEELEEFPAYEGGRITNLTVYEPFDLTVIISDTNVNEIEEYFSMLTKLGYKIELQEDEYNDDENPTKNYVCTSEKQSTLKIKYYQNSDIVMFSHSINDIDWIKSSLSQYFKKIPTEDGEIQRFNILGFSKMELYLYNVTQESYLKILKKNGYKIVDVDKDSEIYYLENSNDESIQITYSDSEEDGKFLYIYYNEY
ncbi:MAG: hypothetical protein K0S47_3616 [Herbinix sp.]|jgi:putative transposon-encoded protein|nr:hypothetical protein [Herbinix sp.]